jgi:AcrR family transcriptional regulator
MATRPLATDLTAAARIRDAALARFAAVGVAATSIRDVAKVAGVSPGLVQHHFRSKAQLRRAVDAFVALRTSEAFADVIGGEPASASAGKLGERISAFIRANPVVFAYIGRSLLEGDVAAEALLGHFLGLARAQLGRLAADELLRPDVDLEWAALHLMLIDVGGFLLERSVSRYLGTPITGGDGLRRMEKATAALFLHGIYRPIRRRRQRR